MGASLGTYNMGVSALAASMVKIIKTIHPDANISLLIGNKSSKEQLLKLPGNKILRLQIVNYRLSPKSNLSEHLFWILFMAVLWRIIPIKTIQEKIIDQTPWLKTLQQADLVGDIRGGDSFSDIYGLGRLVIGSIPVLIVFLMKKKLILLPQTYGPYNSKIGQFIAKTIINKALHILSRDKQGIEEIQKLTNKQNSKKEVIFCPDVAFMLDPILPNSIAIKPAIIKDPNVPLIGVNINGLMYNGGYTKDNMFGLILDYKKFSKEVILNILEKTNAHILFIPHTYHPMVESDPDACNDVMNSVNKKYIDRIHIVEHEYDQSEIKGIIGLCDFFIGSRMHACIAALSQGIPTVGVAYSRKFAGVFDSIGAGDMVADARKLTAEDIINKIMADLENRADLKIRLSNIDSAKNQLKETFQRVLKA
jgi:polysaccharide pyruvyl transferase WcaK-like protein